MVYGSFKYDNRRDNRDDEEALGTIKKGCDDGIDADGADEEEEEANDIIIVTADSSWFTLAYLPFLLLMVVLSCFMLGNYFSIGTTTFSSWLLPSSSTSSLSSSLSSGLSSSYNSNINNNNIDESTILSTQDLDGVTIATHNNIDTNIGQCQTTGTYSSVIEYTNGQLIGYTRAYIGLMYNSPSYSQQKLATDRCYDEKASKYHGNQCPDKKTKIVQAWQQCAEACNMDKRCLTYTAKATWHPSRPFHFDGHYSYICDLHDHYTCGKNDSGIAASELHIPISMYSVFWSGLCRRQDKCS